VTPFSRRLLCLLLATGLAAGAQARLGQTLADLKKRYDSPLPQTSKNTATWVFEQGDSGQLMYSVTFNAQGRSIAEGLKPIKRARFSKETALEFIEIQMAPYHDSKTQRIVKAGEKYRFAGQAFTVGKDEYVILDEPQGVLLIWSQYVNPAVMVVSPEMFQQGD
jgi:hypothetical protein